MNRFEFEQRLLNLVDEFSTALPYSELCESLDLVADYCARKVDVNGK